MRTTVAFVVFIALQGCVGVSSTRLPKSTRFRSITAPADIAAVYSSKSDSPKGSSAGIIYGIFGTHGFPETPDSVRFCSRPPSELVCEAISGGKVVATRELVHGRDFRIEGGALHLTGEKTKGFAGEAMLGVEKHSTVIRLTDSGDVVVTQRHSEAAMALLVVPMARMDTQEALFRRIGDASARLLTISLNTLKEASR